MTTQLPPQNSVSLADDTINISNYTKSVDRTDRSLQRLVYSEPIVSLHDHPFRYPDPYTAEDMAQYRLNRRLELGFDGLASSGTAASVACFNSRATREEIVLSSARLNIDIGRRAGFYVVDNVDDIRSQFEPGSPDSPVGILIGLESLTHVAENLETLELLYALGVRVAGLTYNEGNLLGCGLWQRVDSGLTTQGREYVRCMNELGMAIDLSHVGDDTSMEVVRLSTVPVMISHAGARGLWPTTRMKSDDLIRAVTQEGGVIGVEAAPNTTFSPKRSTQSIESIMDHVAYLVELVGIDHVAFGPDVLFGPHHERHRLNSIGLFERQASVGEVERVAYVDGLENPNEVFWNLVHWMMSHGYSDDEIFKLTGRNAMLTLDAAIG